MTVDEKPKNRGDSGSLRSALVMTGSQQLLRDRSGAPLLYV